MKGMEKLRRKMRMIKKRVIRKIEKEYMFLETNWKTLLHFLFGLFALYCLYGKELYQMLCEIGFSKVLVGCYQFLLELPFALYEVTKDFSIGQLAILLIAVYSYKKGYELQREKNDRVNRRSKMK